MNNRNIHSIEYNYLMNIILTGANIIFPLITFPYVSRILMSDGVGRVTFATTIVHYFLNIASLGIPTYGVRECAKVRDDEKELGKLVYELLVISIISGILVFVFYIISIFFIGRFYEDRTLFYINSVLVIFNNLGVTWLFTALEKYDYIAFRNILFKAISFVLIFMMVRDTGDYLIYAGILVIAIVGPCITGFIWMLRNIRIRKYPECNIRRHLRPISLLFAQSMMVTLYTELDTIMLGMQRGNQEVGYYDAAVKVKMGLLAVIRALGNVTAPRIIYYKKNNMWHNFNTVIQKTINITLFSGIPLSIFSSLKSKEFILVLAGSGYMEAISAMSIITISVIPMGLSNILAGNVLVAYNKEKEMVYVMSLGAVIDLTMNLFLIPVYGAAGAAFATTVTELVLVIAMFFLCPDIVKNIVKSTNFILYSLSALLSGIAIFVILKKLQFSHIINLVISFVVYFFIYIFICCIMKDTTVQDLFSFFLKERKK